MSSKSIIMNDEMLGAQLQKVQILYDKKDYDGMKKILNETLRSFDNGEGTEFAPCYTRFVIRNLYYALIELAFKRYDSLESRLSHMIKASNIKFSV
jgi:hypothetical protein